MLEHRLPLMPNWRFDMPPRSIQFTGCCNACAVVLPRHPKGKKKRFCSPVCREAYYASADRFWDRVEKTDGCWLWTGGRRDSGYGKYGRQPAHRFSWKLHFGDPPDGIVVCHKCDTRLCVRPGHLFLGTRSDNSSDMVSKGRQARGETHSQSVLTQEQVQSIRSRRHAGELCKSIAADLGVSRATVGDIANGKSWSWLEWPAGVHPPVSHG